MKLGSSSSKFALLGVLSLKPSSGYDIKQFVNAASLPANEPFAAEMDAFWQAADRPALPTLLSQAFAQGYQQRSPFELNLGDFVGTILADPDSSYPTRS